VKRYIYILVFLTIIPSVLTAYNVVKRSIFEQNANLFVSEQLRFDNCQVISKHYHFDKDQNRIEVTLFGQPVPLEDIQRAEARLADYHLGQASLLVRQGYTDEESIDLATVQELNQQMRTGIIEDLYKKNEELLRSKDAQIKLLETEILRMRAREMPIVDLAREVRAINNNVRELSVVESVISSIQDSMTYDTVYLAYAKFARRPRRSERAQIEDWLKARTQADTIKLIIN
jgi:hypothetical protein